jgi:hypothetical protein
MLRSTDLKPDMSHKAGGGRLFARLAFGLAVFASAFLLFQVQLLLGKFLLPWFGGTSGVWATCLLFFQVLLLGGYFYAHQVSISCRVSNQGKIHLTFLALTGLWIVLASYFWGSPLLPDPSWKPAPGAAPIAGILKLLFVSIGLPFLLLSSTGPLLQHWYAQLELGAQKKAPYFLYALSNAGSLLGLLSYPLFLEPVFRLNTQSWFWGAGFGFFALCCTACAWQAHHSKLRPQNVQSIEDSFASADQEATARPQRWLWFTLPMLGSVMLLATTNLLTQDVAPVPLLWVLPLCIYLLSFVFTFHGTWYRRGLFHPLLGITALLVILALFRGTDMRVISQIGIFLAFLFAACMVCHGELARKKPGARYLTSFYLLLSGGGAAGGIFVAIIAPSIFPTFWEYQLGLWAVATLLLVILFRDRNSWLHDSKPNLLVPVAVLTVLLAVPKYLVRARVITIPAPFALVYNLGLGLLIPVCVWLAITGGPTWARHRRFRYYEITAIVSFLLLTAALCVELNTKNEFAYRERNFYGAVAVHEDWDADRLHVAYEFMHGRTTHGIQLAYDRKLPASYYGEGSGARFALLTNPQRAAESMRVGAIGLGIGTIASYGRKGDVYRFYEINPAVIDLAQGKRGYFTYLRDSPARIEIAAGDARLSLEAEVARGDLQKFDVLFVDAFSGDSIPVHLLTKEAMALYLSHLRGPDSVIVVNVTNRSIDLSPVVAGLAQRYGLKATLIRAPEQGGLFLRSDFILLTRGKSLDAPEIRQAGFPMRQDPAYEVPENRIWTDDYSNVVRLLRLR